MNDEFPQVAQVVERTPEQVQFCIDLGVLDMRADDTFYMHFVWFEVVREFQALYGGPLNVPQGTNVFDAVKAMPATERAAFRDRVLKRAAYLKRRNP